jgi:hypothetical protein
VTKHGCPEAPEGGLRCTADYLLSEYGLEGGFGDDLTPGRYEVRRQLTRDHRGECGEDVEVHDAPADQAADATATEGVNEASPTPHR